MQSISIPIRKDQRLETVPSSQWLTICIWGSWQSTLIWPRKRCSICPSIQSYGHVLETCCSASLTTWNYNTLASISSELPIEYINGTSLSIWILSAPVVSDTLSDIAYLRRSHIFATSIVDNTIRFLALQRVVCSSTAWRLGVWDTSKVKVSCISNEKMYTRYWIISCTQNVVIL